MRRTAKSGRPDLNRGPHRPERCALPGCATPRRWPSVLPTLGARERQHDGMDGPGARVAEERADRREGPAGEPEVVDEQAGLAWRGRDHLELPAHVRELLGAVLHLPL